MTRTAILLAVLVTLFAGLARADLCGDFEMSITPTDPIAGDSIVLEFVHSSCCDNHISLVDYSVADGSVLVTAHTDDCLIGLPLQSMIEVPIGSLEAGEYPVELFVFDFGDPDTSITEAYLLVVAPGPAIPPAVPTVSGTVLVAMSLLLSSIAIWHLCRRRAAA